MTTLGKTEGRDGVMKPKECKNSFVAKNALAILNNEDKIWIQIV